MNQFENFCPQTKFKPQQILHIFEFAQKLQNLTTKIFWIILPSESEECDYFFSNEFKFSFIEVQSHKSSCPLWRGYLTYSKTSRIKTRKAKIQSHSSNRCKEKMPKQNWKGNNLWGSSNSRYRYHFELCVLGIIINYYYYYY